MEKHRRVMLKLSGEALAGEKHTGFSEETVTAVAREVKEAYDKEVVPYLIKKFNYKNVNEVPKLVKIVINSGLGDIKDNAKSVQTAHDELKAICDDVVGVQGTFEDVGIVSLCS